ncbi:uncharacterized protein [Prorops nasuta]|uniref:uncharacterized protein n=1 Tax=Prorops nasuta TaxID=863751 RepID=UPI0034CEE85D
MENTFKVDKKKGKKEEEKNGEECLENVSDKSLAEKSNQSMLVDDPEVFFDIDNSIGNLSFEYIQKFYNNKNVDVDRTYGVYMDPISNQLMLGNVLFNTDENDDIIIGENKYPGTRGLYELIFMKQPNEYTKDDEKNYKKILLKTNAYRRNRSSEDQIKGSRGSKYKNIISNLITKKSATKSTTSKTLSGLSENQSRTRVAKTFPSLSESQSRVKSSSSLENSTKQLNTKPRSQSFSGRGFQSSLYKQKNYLSSDDDDDDDNDQNQLIPSKMLLNNHIEIINSIKKRWSSKITNVEKIYSLIERKFKDLRDHILTEVRNLSDEINIHNETNDIKLNKVKNDILTYSNEELTKFSNSFKDLRTIVNSEVNNFEKTIKSLEVKIDEKAKVMTEEKVNEKINALVKEFNEKLKDINKPLKTQLLQENQSFSETGITSGSIPLKVIPNPKEVLNKQIDHLKSISNTQNNENKQLKNQLRLENHQPFFGTGIMTSGSIPLKKVIPDAKNNEKGE